MTVNNFNLLSGFWSKQQHSRILGLTLPLILANITTPLLSMVDTAVLGHMPQSHFLAGAAVGGMFLTQLYWICGFLRMSTTGLSAQSLGAGQADEKLRICVQSAALALLLGLLILFLQTPILHFGSQLADASGPMLESVTAYFKTRVWGAPAALVNLALIGWLIGQQCARQVMLIQIVANLINVVLDLLFVFVFDWGVPGVAAASVCAEYFILFASLKVIAGRLPDTRICWGWFMPAAIGKLLQLNNQMLVRNLLLQLTLAFVTLYGARLGVEYAAINAILMQFFVLIALALDAVANAVEALTGEGKGRKNDGYVMQATLRGLFWSGLFALLYSLVFAIWLPAILTLLTDQKALLEQVLEYSAVIILMPLVAHWCFLLDGTFVGLTRGKAMMLSMLVSTAVVFFPTWYIFSAAGNSALWIALLAFLASRGITLGIYLTVLYRRGTLTD